MLYWYIDPLGKALTCVEVLEYGGALPWQLFERVASGAQMDIPRSPFKELVVP